MTAQRRASEMDWYVFAWRWLAHAAVGGSVVLGLGSLAAWLCRQPVRRARVVVLTLLGAVAVPWLGALPVAPRWSLGLLPAPATAPSRGETEIGRPSPAPPPSIESPIEAAILEGDRIGPP